MVQLVSEIGDKRKRAKEKHGDQVRDKQSFIVMFVELAIIEEEKVVEDLQQGRGRGSLGQWRCDEGRDECQRLCEKIEGRYERIPDGIKFDVVTEVVDLVTHQGTLADAVELNHFSIII